MIKAAFRVNGGMGTLIVRANFLQYLYNKFSNICSFDVFGHQNSEVNNLVFAGNNCYDNLFTANQWNDARLGQYHLVVTLDAWPNVQRNTIPQGDEYKGLKKIIDKWEKFKNSDNNERFFRWIRESKPYLYSYMCAQGKYILNCIDIFDDFDIQDEYILRIPEPNREETARILANFGLQDKKYITVQRGANSKLKYKDLPKLWPENYYNELISLIRENFPEYTIVQLGQKTDTSRELLGVDVNCLNRTNADELKAILKHSYLHIDSECGMVHLRKALHGGPSLVFFGPTLPELFGYKGNINLRASVCPTGCAEVTDHWENTCPRGCAMPACMVALTPDFVFGKIKDYLSGNPLRNQDYSQTEKVLQELRKEPNCHLNEQWINDWLKHQKVFGYAKVKIKLKDLYFQRFTGDEAKWVLLPLGDSPVLAYLKGDKEQYYLDQALRKAKLDDNPHSERRMIELFDSIERNGFNKDHKIFIDAVNHIMDGYHRASWLMAKEGGDYEVEVIRIYGNWSINWA